MTLYVRSNRADHVRLEKCTELLIDQPFWWDEMFSSKLEHLMGESQSRYKQYHYLRGIHTHLCTQLRASVPARSLGSCGALTRATTLPSVTFDARGRIHHVVGRLADKQAGPMGACVYVCVGSPTAGWRSWRVVELADVNLEATEGIGVHMFVFPPLLEEKGGPWSSAEQNS